MTAERPRGAELRRLLEAATPGEWKHTAAFVYEAARSKENEAALENKGGGHFIASAVGPPEVRYANAAFIAECRNEVPGLLAENEALRRALGDLYGVASTMAQINAHDGSAIPPHPYVWHDLDERLEQARAALAEPARPETER